MKSTQGILLLNLGTPDDCTTSAVRRYLAEFLMDPFVVDIPVVIRWLLVHGIILRTRPKQSAEAYQAIWTDQGSPLLIYSQQLTERCQQHLGEEYHVELGMRYGKPNIASAVAKLKHCEKITVLPLFPQYSLAATESALDAARQAVAKQAYAGEVDYIQDFFDETGFIESWVALIQQYRHKDHFVLFSYHGLPVKQVHKAAGCQSFCDQKGACPPVTEKNQQCYRAQCYATTHAVVKQLQLQPDQYAVGFQSRLGRIPWIPPYTDELLPVLFQQGVRRLSIACPSFVVDCLETLEEIGMRAKEDWLALGGESFQLLPCLNESEHFSQALVNFLQS